MLGVAARMTDPNWTVIVEQPTAEAFAVTRRLERQLTIAIGLALLGTLVLGYLWGRSFIQRIFALTRVTRSIAEGKLDDARRAHRTRRDPTSSATPSTRWPTGSSSCRRTSGSRNARRCSDASRPGWSTISRTRFRTSATAAS